MPSFVLSHLCIICTSHLLVLSHLCFYEEIVEEKHTLESWADFACWERLVPLAACQHVHPVNHVPLNDCGWQFKDLMMSRMFTFRHERANCVERKGKFTPRSDWLGNVLFSADTRLETGKPMRRRDGRGLSSALCWRSGFLLNRSSVGPDVSVHEDSCTLLCAALISFTLVFWPQELCNNDIRLTPKQLFERTCIMLC